MLLVLCFDLSLVLLKVLVRAAVESGDGSGWPFISNEAKGGRAISNLGMLGLPPTYGVVACAQFYPLGKSKKETHPTHSTRKSQTRSSLTAARSA